MKIARRKAVRLVMLFVVALSTFIMGVSAFNFYAGAVAVLFQPNQSVLETTQILTSQAAAPFIVEFAPTPVPPQMSTMQSQTADTEQESCDNCIQDKDFGLCELVSGEYINYQYGYSLKIPEEMQAMQSPPPAPNHGFVARLRVDADAVIYVDGSYNSTELNSLDEAADENIKYLKEEHGESVVLLKRYAMRLGKSTAIRYVAQFTDSQTGATMIEDEVVSLRKYSSDDDEFGIIYSVSLRSPIYSYEASKPTFEKVLKRWRELELDR